MFLCIYVGVLHPRAENIKGQTSKIKPNLLKKNPTLLPAKNDIDLTVFQAQQMLTNLIQNNYNRWLWWWWAVKKGGEHTYTGLALP